MSIIIHPALSPRGDGDVMTRRAQSDGTSCRVQSISCTAAVRELVVVDMFRG